jgi:hypothetical protein
MVTVAIGCGLWLVALCGTLAACAGDKGEVNYVQPAYVKKSDLLAKAWYYRRTVVDTPENGRGVDGSFGSWVTIGMGDLFTIERIRFDIQEDYLVAYRDYEFVPGSDTAEYEGAGEYRGTPVLAFSITSHFDIQNDYNPATGEKTNTIRENTQDRPWHERDFMRVSWKSAKLSHNALMFPIDEIDQNSGKGASEYIHENDATNPYRARIQPNKGYLDFVNNHYIAPDINTCYYDFDFSMYDITACGAGEIKVRHAFWAVDEEQNKGYQPLYYPDSVTLKDTTTDPDNPSEILDAATNEVVREPIFERFGFYRLDKLTYDNKRGLTESGRLYRMIRFNIWDKSVDDQGDMIPYKQRSVRPIEYYLNWDFPGDLRDTAFEVAAEWNDAFKQTVASLQGKNVDEVEDVFILKDNDCSTTSLTSYLETRASLSAQVEAKVGAALSDSNLEHWCAGTEYFSETESQPFGWQQVGDPRVNMMVWIPNIVPAAFSGYGPMLADPVSGRNVVSTAYVLGWSIDSAATRALEYVDYINDELSLTDLLSGSKVPNYFYEGAHDLHARERESVPLQFAADTQLSSESIAKLEARFARNGDGFESMMQPLENSDHFHERLARVSGTAFEREHVLRSEDLMLASQGKWRPGMEVHDDLYEAASFMGRSRELQQKQQRTRRYLEERMMCPMADLDGALVGLAKSLKNLDRDARLLALRKSIFKAVMLHEVGHNVGLRHNFEGSYDALNYDRSFWDIDKEHGQGQDAEVLKEQSSQPEYKYSSIMDYHGKINGDFRGLGHYDRAAIKFGYGQLVETFKDTNLVGGDSLRQWIVNNDYRDLLYEDADGVGEQGAAYFSSVDQLYDRQDVIFDWTQENLDVDAVGALLASEVPYRFCSDEFAGRTPTCKRFDFGANQRETQVANEIRYKNYFIFNHFRRNRLVLDFSGTAMRSQSTFFDTMLTYQWFYLYRSQNGTSFANTDFYADLAQATAKGLNLMTEVVAMPRPGNYYPCTLNAGAPDEEVVYYTDSFFEYDPIVNAQFGTGPEGGACDVAAPVPLGLGEGFPMFFGFSEEYYNWSFAYLGTYWDKLNALQLFTYPVAYYPRINQDENSLQAYSVSIYRLYDREVNTMLRDLIDYDRRQVGSLLKVDDGVASVVARSVYPGSPTNADETGLKTRINPALARNLQLYSLIYGMAFLTSPYDDALDFADHTRVVVKGAADDFFGATGATDIAECELPEAGITYRAVATQSALKGSIGNVSYDTVERCKSQVTDRGTLSTILNTEKATLAGLTAGTQAYIEQKQEVDEALAAYESAEGKLRQTEQVLLWMRELHRLYEYGSGY